MSWALFSATTRPDLCPLLPQLRTREGSEFLIQHDSDGIIAAWHKAIADSIGRLVSRGPCPAATGMGTGGSRCPFRRAPTSLETRMPRAGLSSAPGRSWEVVRRRGQVSSGTAAQGPSPSHPCPHLRLHPHPFPPHPIHASIPTWWHQQTPTGQGGVSPAPWGGGTGTRQQHPDPLGWC